ncbi:bifunctional pyr operon transcriptional regulator/uracil phosphoribosyltransferase PyrR [Paludisphaera mucosa]|uniref:Bifunctional protein PyrR n=1 Tax=Paludisphaera mucosa TaxID=3030827 RepID=A0ABT6FFP3_9BACT|nr:bifunctional pyr operon transcriptional regulator/uracil phosphoribosyltransferase PyrR [Paludisphaera mucosa]MDG3006311.1 bifunctional pyr operon transcriptional regulator/uracil phosphoribosyltransferase PyrR [Paludisphaera mucosa]
MSSEEVQECDAGETGALIKAMAGRIWEGSTPSSPVRLVGVRSRGVPLAERLAAEAVAGGAVGAVDITLYRDDLDQARRWPVLRGTEIPFDVDGADVVLVDDVLFTGRTIRAAIDAICDLGRPARIRLAVLVDRGWRELPIQPDVVGLKLKTDRCDRVRVRLRPIDPVEEIVRIPAAPRLSPS